VVPEVTPHARRRIERWLEPIVDGLIADLTMQIKNAMPTPGQG